MKILFISYTAVSLKHGSVRSVAMVQALAEAGHHVDVLAPSVVLPSHSNIKILWAETGRNCCRNRLRWAGVRAVFKGSYDVIHACDSSVFFIERLCRWKKIPFVYDAVRRFSGAVARVSSRWAKLFPDYLSRQESIVLERAKFVFSTCPVLTHDLESASRKACVVTLPDIPMQPLYGLVEVEKDRLLNLFGVRPGAVVVCHVLPQSPTGIRELLIAAHKVIDLFPDTVFFFKGARKAVASKMAKNLDIMDHCVFMDAGDSTTFLAALEMATIVVFGTQTGRYIQSEVYTLLNSPAVLVAVHDGAYKELLTDERSLLVAGSDALAGGIIQAIKEPLFSAAVATEAQQLMRSSYTYSSFKHKVRMIYHDCFNPS